MSDTGDAARDPAAGLARELGAARAEREQQALARLAELLGVVYRLRDPDGCPWDLGQSLDSMALNLLEEACESHEAVANGSDADVREELGDVLIYLANLADKLGIEPLQAAFEKLERNRQKYPVEKARGSAAKYDELTSK